MEHGGVLIPFPLPVPPLAAAAKGFARPTGYFTAAGQLLHTAALLSSFPATLHSSEWTLGFMEGWCGFYLLFIPDALDKTPADHTEVCLRSRSVI